MTSEEVKVNPALMNTELSSSRKQDGSLPGHVNSGVLLKYKMCSSLEDNKAIALIQTRSIKLFQMDKSLSKCTYFHGVMNFCVQPVT